MKTLFLAHIFFACAICGFSQSNFRIDSLKNELQFAKNKTLVLTELSGLYQTVSAEKALYYASEAYKEAIKQDDRELIALSMKLMAKSYLTLNEYEKSNHFSDSAVILFHALGDIESEIECQLMKAVILMLQGSYNEALDLFELYKKKASEAGAKKIYSSILMQEGRIHRVRGNYEEALACFQQSLEVADEIGNTYLMGHAYHFLGLVNQDQQRFEQAIDNYLKALPVFEEQDNLLQIPYLLISLGSAFRDIKNYEESLTYYKNALSYFSASNDRWGMYELNRNLGLVHLEMHNL
ncbi:MAG: tetratricopeptide repeat protein, partial [Bacteroidales bacterium]